MQAFAVFAAVLAAASASPQFVYNGLGYSGLGYGYAGINGLGLAQHGLGYSSIVAPAVQVAPLAHKTQYHAQDEFGQASFGHSEPTQSHNAVRDAAGGVRGTFSYISPEGKQLTTHYVADHNGYRVASNNLPVAPTVALVGPAPVQDTPEVVAAKVQHFAAVAEAQARSGRKKRGIAYTAGAYTYGDAVLNSAVVGPSGSIHSSQVVNAGVHGLTYAAPIAYSNQIVHHAGVQGLTYAAAPAVVAHQAIAPVAYSSQVVHGAPIAHQAIAYSAGPAVIANHAVRSATLTQIANNPGHAVSYRVD